MRPTDYAGVAGAEWGRLSLYCAPFATVILQSRGFSGFVAKGQVAQLVEQRTENPCVGGSIPPLATTVQSCARRCLAGRDLHLWNHTRAASPGSLVLSVPRRASNI